MNIVLWCLQAALIGFIGYNYVVNTLKLDKFAWHVVEIPYFILSGMFVALYSEYGFEWQNIGFDIRLLKAVITGFCMMLLHLSWVNDALYYIWAVVFNIARWENRKSAKFWLLETANITHASWTFAGMFGYTDRKVILAQAGISVLVVVIIQALL